MNTSPWWYRGRSPLFGALYGIGFAVGGGVSSVLHGTFVPAYAAFGTNVFLPLAVTLTGICFLLRAWGSSYLSAAVVWAQDASTERLIVAGPFRFTRNPLYLGNLFLAVGIGLQAPVAGFAFIVLSNAAFVYALMRHEEIEMQQRYGERFTAYRVAVPALVPRLHPAPGDPVRPSLRQGLLAEVFSGSVFAGFLIAAILHNSYGWFAFFVLYVAGIIAQHKAAAPRRSGR